MNTTKQIAHKAGWLYLGFLVVGIFNFFYIPPKIKYHNHISDLMALPMSVGEVAMIFWLLFKGVKEH